MHFKAVLSLIAFTLIYAMRQSHDECDPDQFPNDIVSFNFFLRAKLAIGVVKTLPHYG